MPMTTEQMFLALLRSELTGEKLSAVTPNEDLLKLATRHDLLHLVCEYNKRIGAMTVKENKKLKELENDPQSILNTNSAKMAEQPEEKQPIAKPKMKSVLAILLVVVLLVGVFVGGGLISEAQYQAKLAKEEAQSLRDDAEVRYIDAPEAVDGSLESGITAMYYSQENGMWLTLTAVNGLDKETAITRVSVTLKNSESEAVIAQGVSEPKNWSVAVDEAKEFTVYFPPKYVKITDDPLETVSIDLTVDHEVEN